MSFVRTGMTYQPSSVGNNTIKNQTKQNSGGRSRPGKTSRLIKILKNYPAKQQLTFPVLSIITVKSTIGFLQSVFLHHITVKHLLRLQSGSNGYPFPVRSSLVCDNEMHCAVS